MSEQFFIGTHQPCELWLKQVTIDLDATADAMTSYGPEDEELVLELLQQTAELLRMLHDQAVALRLPLRHFVEFRPFLDGASGARSAQVCLLTRLLRGDRREGHLYRAFGQLPERKGHQRHRRLRAGPRRRRQPWR